MDEPRARLKWFARKWQVEYDRVLETATSLVAFGVQADQPVVLKIARLRSDERNSGYFAAAFDGCGGVPVIAHEHGATLMQRLLPGTPLTDVVRDGNDHIACAAIADVIRRMEAHRVECFGFVAENCGDAFDQYLSRGDKQLDPALVHAARDVYAYLQSTQREPRLLHGDLQHYNILFDEQLGWVAIDPKGCVAEMEAEFGAALRNPHGMPDLYSNAAQVDERIRLMAEGLDVNLTRVRKWAFAQAVLSAIWTIEDEGAIQRDSPALRLAYCLSA